jgi:hypothetical protein
MFTVQCPDAARLDPQVAEVIAKSDGLAPEREEGLRLTELEAVLETVTVCDALADPALMLPKDRLDGEAVTFPAGATPSPDTETCWGLLTASLVYVRVPVRVPAAVGLKSIVVVQLEETASVDPQVFL